MQFSVLQAAESQQEDDYSFLTAFGSPEEIAALNENAKYMLSRCYSLLQQSSLARLNSLLQKYRTKDKDYRDQLNASQNSIDEYVAKIELLRHDKKRKNDVNVLKSELRKQWDSIDEDRQFYANNLLFNTFRIRMAKYFIAEKENGPTDENQENIDAGLKHYEDEFDEDGNSQPQRDTTEFDQFVPE